MIRGHPKGSSNIMVLDMSNGYLSIFHLLIIHEVVKSLQFFFWVKNTGLFPYKNKNNSKSLEYLTHSKCTINVSYFYVSMSLCINVYHKL